MLKSVEIHGFPNSPSPLRVNFNRDINIFTGRNGSGKTNLLKALWYTYSGNMEHLFREVPLDRITLRTDTVDITLERGVREYAKVINLNVAGQDTRYLFSTEREAADASIVDEANELVADSGKSLFLPTFRRIEGGYTLDRRRLGSGPLRTAQGEIGGALAALSASLSHGDHSFIAAISSHDIDALLTRKFAELTNRVNHRQQEIATKAIDKIREFKRQKTNSTNADLLLDEVVTKIEEFEPISQEIMRPLDSVERMISRLFAHAGVRFGPSVSFGDAASAIRSTVLSAGEKQMLSFICYNALFTDTVIFIDEPELSLHVDWQRQLFPILESQGTGNQFIVATHSPFIYAKYPEKEILIGDERGDERGAA